MQGVRQSAQSEGDSSFAKSDHPQKLMQGNRATFRLAGLILVAGSYLISSAGAAEPAFTLEAVPSTMKLAVGDKGRVAVIARNTSSVWLQVVKLDYIASDGLAVAMSKSNPDTTLIPPGGAVRWVIEVAQTQEAREAGEAQFFLDYSTTENPPESGTKATTRAATTIQRIQPATLDKVLEARAESVMKMLEDPNSGTIFLIVHNKSNFPISIRPIEVAASAELDTKWKNDANNTPVAPQSELAFALAVKAKDIVQPGKYLLLFNVGADWTEEGSKRSGSTIVKYEFDAGVLGSSAMLAAVGVPSFLLLPGFLMIVLFVMLWNHVSKRTEIPLNLKSGEFWCLAILLSLTTALIYPFLTHRNYLKGYNFRDVYWLWFGCAGLAVIVWLIVVGYLKWAQSSKEKKERSRTFSTSDSPVAALRKLALNGQGFELEQVRVRLGDSDVQAFLLHKGGTGEANWVAPNIGVIPPADEGDASAGTAAALEAQLKQVNAPALLADLIEKKGIVVHWVVNGLLRGVTAVPAYTTANAQPLSLVELK